MRPVDAVTLEEASRILGCSISSVRRHIFAEQLSTCGTRGEHRILSQADVEELAAQIYPWWKHLSDPDSWWVTGHAAARLLGVSRQCLDQLSAAGRLPYVRHRDGTRLYRRAQLEVMCRRDLG